MEYKQITFEIKNKVARIGFGKNSKKPLTTLELETLEELKPVLKEIEERQNTDVSGLILFSHKENVFLAGMNVTVIRDLVTVQDGITGAKQGQEICSQIEDLLIPTIACIDGVCLGGGTELALACKIIVVSDSPYTSLGVPEVQLGLLPAFGGSYRLPRRIDLPVALDLMLSGRMVNGETAMEMGLVDQIYPRESLVETAISDYIINPEKNVNIKGTDKSSVINDSSAQKAVFKKARESVLKKTGGHYETPLRILDHLESSLGCPRSTHLESEAQLLGEIAISEQSRNLQNIYFLHANSQKYNGPAGEKGNLMINKGAVVGAGTMGGGIAWLMARNNMAPILKDISKEGLDSGLKKSEATFAEALKRKKISEDEFKKKQGSIISRLDYNGFKNINLAAEAVVEDKEIKESVLTEIEHEVSEDCLITSSTSSLSINNLASIFAKPERFAGLHFFYPVNRVPLVEIITHDQIAPETISALYKWAVRVKKIPVVVKNGPGFLLNRILTPFINEALYLLDDGIPIDDLEQACLNFGMPMGPCHLLDNMGIDAGYKVVNCLKEKAGDRFKPAAIFEKISKSGYYGKKSKKGIFHYDDRGRKLEINKDILKLLPAEKIKMNENDVQKKVIIPMINEAATVLQDGIAGTVEDIDLALIFGAGFPRFRGGLLKYADSLGLDNILKTLDQFAEDTDTVRFEPCSLIRELAEKNKSFYS